MLIPSLLEQKLIAIHVTIARLQSLITKALVLKEGTWITWEKCWWPEQTKAAIIQQKKLGVKNSLNQNFDATWKDYWVYQQGGGKTTFPMTPDGVSHYFVLPGTMWVPYAHADKFAMVFPTSALCSADLCWTYWLGHFSWDSLTFLCNLCSSSLVPLLCNNKGQIIWRPPVMIPYFGAHYQTLLVVYYKN